MLEQVIKLDIQSALPEETGNKELDKLFKKGKQQFNLKKYDKAADTFSTILKQKPDHFPAIEKIGQIAREMGNHEKSLLFFKALTEHMPMYALGYGYVAAAFMSMEQYEEAIPYLRKSLTFSEYSFAYHGLGNCYRYLGKKEEAKECFYKALQMDGDDPRFLYGYLFFFYKFTDKNDPYLKHIHDLLEKKKKSMDTEDIANLYTTLYKAYEDLEEYDKALLYAGEAGKARLREKDYKIKAHENTCTAVKTYFDQSFFEETETSENESEQPVFILAMPRSGTTLLEQILHSHKDITGIGEDDHFAEILGSHSAMKPHNNTHYMYRNKNISGETWGLNRLADEHLAYLDKKSLGAKRVVDKAISHYNWVGMLYLCFPKAHFIHLTRDPLSSAISSYTRNFVFNHHPYTNDLYKLGTAMRLHYDIMEHWKSVIPTKILDVSYENIVDDTETQARRIIDFLGLPWDENCLNFHKTAKVVRTASADQVRKKIYKSSLKTWQKYEKHLPPLLEGLGPYAPQEALYITEKYQKNDVNSQ